MSPLPKAPGGRMAAPSSFHCFKMQHRVQILHVAGSCAVRARNGRGWQNWSLGFAIRFAHQPGINSSIVASSHARPRARSDGAWYT